MLSKLERFRGKGSFLEVCRNDEDSNFFRCQICKYWVCKRSSSTRGRQKEDDDFECRTCASQETEADKNCLGIKLNGQSLEVVERFCYLSDTIGARRGAVNRVLVKKRKEWGDFKDLLPLLISKRFFIVSDKSRSYSASVCSIKLYGSEAWLIKEPHVIRLEKNDMRITDQRTGFLLWNLDMDYG